MTEAAQPQEPQAPPNPAAPSTPPAAEPPAQEAPEGEGRQPTAPNAYAALRPELSAQGRRAKAATEALGLDKNATEQEIADAIAGLKAPKGIAPATELPPELAAEQARLQKRAWQSAERDFGEDFAQQAQGLQDLVFNTDDPYELTAALHELAQSVTTEQPAGESAPPAGEQPAAPVQDKPKNGVDMEVGQPGWKVQPDEDDKPGSGDTRGFFAKAFAGVQRPRR